MKAKFTCLAFAGILCGAAEAQSIMEHAAAAAGATAGTAGGKVMSNVLDSVLGKAAATGAEVHAPTAKQPVTKVEPAANPATAVSPSAPAHTDAGASVAPAAGLGTGRTTLRRHTGVKRDFQNTAFENSDQRLSARAYAETQPPSPDDFSKVKEGSPRQDVFAALGTPSSRVTIPDDGHLIEIMSYSEGRRRLGTVRLDNGQVVSISTTP